MPEVMANFTEIFEPQCLIAEGMRDQLMPAIQAGLVDFYLPPAKDLLSADIQRFLTPVVTELIHEIPLRFFEERGPDRRTELRFAIGAEQAALYSHRLNTSISSTDRQFLAFLNKCSRDSTIQIDAEDKAIWRAQFLTEELFRIRIPRLQDLPLDEIVDVRKETGRYIDYFRREIFEVAARIESEIWDAPRFEKEVRYLITSEIRPRLKEALHQGEDELDRLFKALARSKDKICAGSVIATVTAYFTTVPTWVLASAAASLIIESTIQEFRRLKDESMAQNGYGFLIEVDDRL